MSESSTNCIKTEVISSEPTFSVSFYITSGIIYSPFVLCVDIGFIFQQKLHHSNAVVARSKM